MLQCEAACEVACGQHMSLYLLSHLSHLSTPLSCTGGGFLLDTKLNQTSPSAPVFHFAAIKIQPSEVRIYCITPSLLRAASRSIAIYLHLTYFSDVFLTISSLNMSKPLHSLSSDQIRSSTSASCGISSFLLCSSRLVQITTGPLEFLCLKSHFRTAKM